MIKNSIENIRPKSEELNGIYRGVVEDSTSDPEKAGRCKIRVFGVHTENKYKSNTDGIPTDELPGAEPAFGLFEGSMSGFGSWTVPLQGSHVFLFFEAGHPLQPRYFASAPGIPSEAPEKTAGFNDPDENYPISSKNAPHQPNALNEPDFHKLGRNEGISDTIVQSKKDNKITGVDIAAGSTGDEPDPYYSTEYPHNKVFATNSGITIEVDDTNGEERIHIYHPSNSYIEISPNGDLVIRNAKDSFEIVDNNKKKYIINNYDRTVDNNRTSKVGSNNTEVIGSENKEEIGGDYTLHVKGKLYISADGGVDIGGGSNINQDAPEIHLNDGIASKKGI